MSHVNKLPIFGSRSRTTSGESTVHSTLSFVYCLAGRIQCDRMYHCVFSSGESRSGTITCHKVSSRLSKTGKESTMSWVINRMRVCGSGASELNKHFNFHAIS